MKQTIHRQYVPVERMYKGDRFLTHRSGWVTAVSEPYQQMDSIGCKRDWVIDVKRDSDGGVFTLIGINRYNVVSEVVS